MVHISRTRDKTRPINHETKVSAILHQENKGELPSVPLLYQTNRWQSLLLRAPRQFWKRNGRMSAESWWYTQTRQRPHSHEGPSNSSCAYTSPVFPPWTPVSHRSSSILRSQKAISSRFTKHSWQPEISSGCRDMLWAHTWMTHVSKMNHVAHIQFFTR